MSISGIITCNQLACPLQDDDKASNTSLVNIVVKCYRLNESELKLTEKDLLLEGNRFAATITCTVDKSKSQTNSSQRIQSILYTCNYAIEQLSPGIYSVFAYERCEEAGESFVYPQKQAFGWSVSETASKWTQHNIDNSNTTVINANIILRKPHSFFSIGYPIKTDNARFCSINQIPILQLNGMTPANRGYSHGYLLAPHILDWFYFYLLEENFQSIVKYQEFYTLVDPASNFFHYPVDYLLEIEGLLRGMQARTDCDLFLYELNRPFDLIDLLAMNSYIERRTTKPDPRTNGIIGTSTVALDSASINHPHCSQVVVWNRLTTDKRIITGRNMDGECDIRRVTVSTTLLFAVNSSDKSRQYRYISLMWPGMVGTLSGVNETGLYCMENAGPSQIGGEIKGLTPVSYVASHLLRTLNARLATITEVKNAFEAFAADRTVNNDSRIWPTKRASSELKGSICGPGCVFVLTTMSNGEGNAFVLEGDRYGGRIRASMEALPFIPDCIMATNHFHLYDYPSSSPDRDRNFDSYVSFSSMHRYESMRYQLEQKFRSKSNVVHLNLENIRSLLQSACEGRTEHAIEVELEINGNITIHVHLARLEFGLCSSHRVTGFEDLANEIYYDVFEYLDSIDSYEIFFNLNKRFQNLFFNSPYLLKINVSSLSKTIFQSYYQNIIIPYQHHIQSFYLSNPFIIDNFLRSDGLIQQFTHLQAFVINDIESKYLENLLNALLSLPNLSTLVIICKRHHVPNRGHLYKQIFRLSELKYCKLSLSPLKFFEYVHREGSDIIQPGLCGNDGTNAFSPITHLVIEDTIVLDEFSALLSYVPQLRHLSIKRLCTSTYSQPNVAPIVSQQLTHVSLDLGNVYFGVFELLLENVLHKAQVLHLSTPADQTYLSASRWESLIPLHLPHLRIFSIEHRVHTSGTDGETYMNLIDQFRSSFWTERQWFFAAHEKFMGESCEMYFYSTDPYRKRQFTLDLELTKTTTLPTKELQMTSVHHLELGDEKCTINWTKYFPNVTQLTLKQEPFKERNYVSSMVLRQMLPLEQITQLDVYLSSRYFKEFIQLLISLPNICKLNLHRTGFQKDSDLLKSDESILAMSTKNKIKEVKLALQYCAFEDMKLLVNLFPQLLHLTLSMAKGCSVEIVQYLLTKNNEKTPHLNSIYLKSFDSSLLEKIKAELRSEKMRPVEIVADGHFDICLWC